MQLHIISLALSIALFVAGTITSIVYLLAPLKEALVCAITCFALSAIILCHAVVEREYNQVLADYSQASAQPLQTVNVSESVAQT